MTSTSLGVEYRIHESHDAFGTYFQVLRGTEPLRDAEGFRRTFKSRASARKAITRERIKDARNKV